MKQQAYPVECKGRDPQGNDALSKPVPVTITIQQHEGSNMISSMVACTHNTGSHGERCKAAKGNGKSVCPYSFDLPHALESVNRSD